MFVKREIPLRRTLGTSAPEPNPFAHQKAKWSVVISRLVLVIKIIYYIYLTTTLCPITEGQVIIRFCQNQKVLSLPFNTCFSTNAFFIRDLYFAVETSSSHHVQNIESN